jgi:DNA mismatch repair protein MutS2
MDERTFSTLELAPLLELLAAQVQTDLGRRRALALLPSTDRAAIEAALDWTSECADYLSTGERFGLGGIEDPEPALTQLPVEGTILTALHILVLERLLSVAAGIRDVFRNPDLRERYPRLAAATARIPDLRGLLSAIRGKILPGGEIDDNASPELRLLRREIGDARARINRTLESILRGQPKAVQDEIVTFRNGRFVIPVRTDSRGFIPGVVHGLSSSGQTTFVEPLNVIDQNNELVRLREQEEAEISRILFAITQALRENIGAIRAAVSIVGEIDFGQAKAKLSIAYQCVRPKLSHDWVLLLRDGRHLLLEHGLRRTGSAVVPITVDLDGSNHVLVVSGPNAGGKTVVVKTVGLVALMAQMGLHVPAREAVLPVFDQILADIGDQQSIAANLSTFTAHMRNIAMMTETVTPQTLILLDEVGTGTDPDEGAALAVGIVDFFRRAGATAIATTHYPGLKMWASQTQGVRNASVEFDEQTLRPTYRLILGIAGASSGLDIARRMNIPEEILDEARGLIEPEHVQAREYLSKLKAALDAQEEKVRLLEQDRQQLARDRERLDQEAASRETKRSSEFGEALAAVIREFSAEGEKMVQSVKNRIERERLKSAVAGRAAELRRTGERLRRQVEGPEPGTGKRSKDVAGSRLLDAEIREGDRVRILSLDKEGTVDTISGDNYRIAVGSLTFRTDKNDLQLASHAAAQAPPASISRLRPGFDIDEVFPAELKVIGMTADEATDRVDKFLDEAFLAGAEKVRIIHGHGKGILRRVIADLLAGHPHVERSALAPPDQGGAAVTLVELRK